MNILLIRAVPKSNFGHASLPMKQENPPRSFGIGSMPNGQEGTVTPSGQRGPLGTVGLVGVSGSEGFNPMSLHGADPKKHTRTPSCSIGAKSKSQTAGVPSGQSNAAVVGGAVGALVRIVGERVGLRVREGGGVGNLGALISRLLPQPTKTVAVYGRVTEVKEIDSRYPIRK